MDSETGPPTRVRVVAAVLAVAALVALVVVQRLGDGDGADETAASGDGATTGGEVVPPGGPSPVALREVAADLGLTEPYNEMVLPPDCLFNEPGDPSDPSDPAYAGQEGALADCLEERSAGGVAIGDFDADGDPDLYLTRLRDHGLLYENDGDGGFTDVTAEHGLDELPRNGNGAGWADLENDGYPDLYVTTLAEDRFYLFMNDGDGPFTEEAEARGAALADDEPRMGFGVAFGDVDNDGWVDIHTTEWSGPARYATETPHHARLLRNVGASAPGTFTDVTVEAGVELTDVPSSRGDLGGPGAIERNAFGSTFVDLDSDGWQDLLVTSDYGTVRLFWNDGDGTFTEGTADTTFGEVSNAMGSTFGDVDGDGDLDWFTSSIAELTDDCTPPSCIPSYSGNKLFRNDGGRRFTDITDDAGVDRAAWAWGAALADLDNDGALDLAVTNGQDYGEEGNPADKDFSRTRDRLWIGDGRGGFTEVGVDAGFDSLDQGKGMAVADLDGSGTLDLIVVNSGKPPRVHLSEPREPAHWLRVRVTGAGSGRDAWGAVVTVTPAGGADPIVRHVGVGTHFLGQSEMVVHAGLGPDGSPVDVEVRFPATGEVLTMTDVPVDQVLEVAEPG